VTDGESEVGDCVKVQEEMNQEEGTRVDETKN